MGALLTPKLVIQIAEGLGARGGPEWALAYALASGPLPPGWAPLASDDGSISYFHDSGLVPPQQEHPLLPAAQRTLAQLRSQASVGDSAANLVGPFEDFDSPGTEFFYVNVGTGERVAEAECPPSRIVPPLPEDLRQMLLAPEGGGEEGEAQQGRGLAEAEAAGSLPPAPLRTEEQQQEQQEPGEQRGATAGGEGAEALRLGDSEATAAGPGPGSREVQLNADADARAGPGPGSRAASASASALAARTASRSPSQQSTRAALEGLTLDPGEQGLRPGSGGGGGGGAAVSKPVSRGASANGYVAGGVPGSGASVSTDGGTVLIGSVSSVEAEASRGAGSQSALSGLTDLAPPAAPASRPPSAASPAAASPAARSRSTSVAATGTGRVMGEEEEEQEAYAGGDGGSGSAPASSRASRHGDAAGSLAGGGGGGGCGGAMAAGRDRLSSSVSGRSTGTVGSGASMAAGADVRGPAPPASGRLTFFGWWFEDIESSDLTFRIDCKQTAGGGLAPRQCVLSYELRTGTFAFTARDPVTPPAPGQPADRVPELTVRGIPPEQVTLCSTGRQADPWDLHLGARLTVLGRPLVLKNAELATAQWHAAHCKRLAAMREKLGQELQKYKPRVLRPCLVRDHGLVRLQTGQALRHMAAAVRDMAEELRQYRPAMAESYMASLPLV